MMFRKRSEEMNNAHIFRVIFLECDLNLCKEHVVQRLMNVDTGSYNDLTLHAEELTKKQLAMHPLDKKNVVEAEVSRFVF